MKSLGTAQNFKEGNHRGSVEGERIVDYTAFLGGFTIYQCN
ncbi:MAG: hypothetical protein AB3N16_04920 [Flavobacteriaceae bacterium]